MNIFLRTLAILVVFISVSEAQITISGALGGTNIVIDNASPTSLSGISFGETNTNDIATSGTFILDFGAGNGFRWATVPNITFAGGGDIAAVEINTISGSALSITISGVATTTGLDAIYISNLNVLATSPPSIGQVAIISRASGVTGGTAIVNGSIGMSYGLMSSKEAPIVPVFTQITVTGAIGGTNICINNPTPTSLNGIVIGETGNDDIKVASGAGSTFILSLGSSSGFVWAAVPSVSIAGGGDLTGATVNTISGAAISITLTGATTAALDRIYINNLFVRAVSPPTSGQAVVLTRLAGASGGTATVTGSVGANYGVLSSVQIPNTYISSLNSIYCSNSPQILLSAFPTVVGSTSLFSLQKIAGPGTVTSGVLNFASGSYFINPNSITGVSSLVGTSINILYSSTLPGGCVTATNQVTTIFGVPAVDFNLPTDGATIGNMRQSDVTFNLVGSPTGGSFSGNGVNGNLFDARIVPINQNIPITYTATLNQCSNSIIKNIKVVSSTGVLSLQPTYCISQPLVNVTIIGGNLPQPFSNGVYELVTILGPGISGTVNASGTGGNFTFNAATVPSNRQNLIQKIKIVTRRRITTAFVTGAYWFGLPVSTCLQYPSLLIYNFLPYTKVNLPYAATSIDGINNYQLNNDFNYVGAPFYYCVGATGYGAVLNHYDYKGAFQGYMTNTLQPYWETQPDIEQEILIFSNPPAPNIALPSSANCEGGTIGNYTATNVVPGGTVYWWDNAVTPVLNGIGSLTTGISVNGNALSIVNSSPLNSVVKATQQFNGCISNASTFPGIVYSRPPRPSLVLPTVTGSQFVNLKVCQNGSLSVLSVTGIASTIVGASYKWYRNNFGDDLFVSSPTYSPSISDLNVSNTSGNVLFYVSQVVNGCESSVTGLGALQVNIGITSLPGFVNIPKSDFEYCASTTSINLVTVTAANNSNKINIYKLSFSPFGTTLLGQNATDASGNFFINKNLITQAGVDFNQPSYTSLNVSQVENGCEGFPSSVTFNIYAAPEAPKIDNPEGVFCNGAAPRPITLTSTNFSSNFVNLFDSTGIVYYGSKQYVDNGLNSRVVFDVSSIVGTTGIFKFNLNQTFGVCTTTSSVAKITLKQSLPSPALDVNTNPINPYCFGEIIRPFRVVNTPGNTIEWRNAANTVIGLGNIYATTISGTTLGTTFNAFQFSDGCYSTLPTSVQLVIYPVPSVPVVEFPTPFCSTNAITIYNLKGTVPGTNILTWYLDPFKNTTLGTVSGTGNYPSGIDLANGNQRTTSFYASNTAIYTSPIGKNCESLLSKVDVTVNPTPRPTFRGNVSEDKRRGLLNDTICKNVSAVSLTNLGNPNGGLFYVNTKATSPITDFNPGLYLGPTKLIYSFTTSFTGVQCNGDTSIIVNVVPPPISDFRVSSLCVGDTIQLSSSISGAAFDPVKKYKWTFSSAIPLTSDSISNPIILFNNPLDYPISLNVETKLGCKDIRIRNFQVDPYPTISFLSKNNCLGGYSELDDKTSFGVRPFGRLLWNFGDGETLLISSTGFNVSSTTGGNTYGTFNKIFHKYTTTGVYFQSLNARSQNGCITTLTSRFFMVPSRKIESNAPYIQDFESDNGGFIQNKESSSWEFGTPNKKYINTAASGTKAWVTKLEGSYIEGDTTSVYCPCFDISGLQKPMISLSIRSAFDRPGLDGVVLQVYDDNTRKWYPVGNVNNVNRAGLNWYSQSGIAGRPGNQAFANVGWSLADSLGGWKVARYKLDNFTDESGAPVNLNPSSLKFRIALGSLGQTGTQKGAGFAFDDFSILERDKLLILETFTNTSNTTEVPLSDKRAEFLVNSNRKDLIGLSYHLGFPGKDSLNQLNIADPSAKALYYGVSQTPYAVLMGNKAVGNAFSIGQDKIDIEALQSAKFAMSVTSVNTGSDTYAINVSVMAKEDFVDETFITVALIERTLSGANLNAVNGQNRFEWTMRKLLPDAAGVTIRSAWKKGDIKSFPYQTSLNNPFDAAQVGTVALLQNKKTKEVYQSAYTGPQPIITPIPVTSINKPLSDKDVLVYPNPTTDEINIQFNRELTKDIHFLVYDMLGNVMTKGIIAKDINLKKIDTNEFPSGIYFLKIDGLIKKVTVIK